MAISYVGKSTFASGTAGLTVAAVTGVQANDLILLYVESANQPVATPTGYTAVPSGSAATGTANAAGGVALQAFYRVATGADATVSVADSGDHTTAIKVVYRGVDTTTPFDATTVNGIKATASTSSSYPGITTVTANSWIVYASALDLDAASTATTSAQANAALTGITERHDQTVASGFGGGLVITDGVKATAGASGNLTATVTSTVQVYVTIALRPAPVTGTMAPTESGADAFASNGDVFVVGALAATESGADTFAGAGPGGVSPGVSGSLAATESGSDTFAGTGDVIVKGSLAVSETGSDAFSSTGKVIVKGSLSATEAGSDTFASNGDVFVKGSLAATETGADTFAAAGDVFVKGTLAATETGSDTFTATGGGVQVATGTLAATESGADTFAAVGDVIVRGALAVSEAGSDTFAGAGDVIVKGTLAVTESGADTLASTGKVIVRGSLAATETGQDTFVGNGGAVRTGDLAATEAGADAFAATGAVTAAALTGSMSATEAGADTFGGYAAGYVEPGYVGGVSGTVSNGVTITGAQAVLLFKIYKLHGLWTQPLVVSPTSRVAGDLTQTVSGTTTVTVSTTAGDANLSGNVGTMIEELAALHGLTTDLVTTATSRSAGTISQTFTTVGTTTTVARV